MPIQVSEAIDSDTAVVVTLFDKTSGGYVDGIYVDPAEVPRKALASVQQPTPKQIEFLEGSERSKSLKVFYLNKEVNTSRNGTDKATEILHRGNRYKVVHAGDWEDFGWFFAMGARL